MLSPHISIVVPLYNEEKVFSILIERLDRIIASNNEQKIEIVLVDDGSKDTTPDLMEKKALADENYTCVFLSRNYGHQIAVSAGMANVKATEAIMIIDGDLQDPPELISTFFKMIKNGYDVVYAIRKNRKEGAIKKSMYWIFYRILRKLSEIAIPWDSGDFSMISKRVNDIIVAMPERSRFIRGIRTWVGFKQIGISYERESRVAGQSKYSLKALFKLAYDGIINFSFVPLKLITTLGLSTILISIIYLFYVLIKKILGYSIPSGFTTLIFALILFGGVQLISLGIIGEYMARIYLQVKSRPLFIIDKIIINKELIDGTKLL